MQTLNRIKSGHISLEPESPKSLRKQLNDTYITEVEELTNTVVSHSERGSETHEVSLLLEKHKNHELTQ